VLAAGLADGGLQAPRLRREHRAAEFRDRVIPPPLVIVFRIGPVGGFQDEPLGQQAVEERVKRAAAQADQAVGPRLDLADDVVAVPRLVGERQQDLERKRCQRQERSWIGERGWFRQGAASPTM
jgi:hypothetical protein